MHDAEAAALVAAAGQGDSRAWEELVGAYSGLVWAVTQGHRLSPADAADVTQTTWLRLVENLSRLHDPGRVGAWLATTARRECLRVLRGARREPATEAERLELVPDDAPPVDAELIQAERTEALWQCLETASPRCRELLRVLTADPTPSYTEVSAALDMPIGSIGPTRRRCMEHLRRRLVAAGWSMSG